MSFVSYLFLIFFPLVTLGYFALPHRWRWCWLLAASCYFYMAFIPVYILILFFTITIDYFAGIAIEDSNGPKRRAFLIASILANVGVLAFFKYFNFFESNIAALAELLHLPYSSTGLNIILPIGLSFHTFQSLSYTVEVYRGNQKAERHPGIFALYVMFYPQLVAGPIERPQNLLTQFRSHHQYDNARVIDGLRLMLWGFFKKIVIADRLAVCVNLVYAHPNDYHGWPIIVATYLFALQIYCDFSGYTDIARGAAQVMGFNLMLNFRRPYFATSVADFWKRWHISLSTWFRDYLYIPLGGSRVGTSRLYSNLLVVFLVSGLWHGASWTFVIWGGLNGIYLVSSLITQSWRQKFTEVTGLAKAPYLLHFLRIIFTFHLILISWFFFRATSLQDLWTLLGYMSQIKNSVPLVFDLAADHGLALTLGAVGVLFFFELGQELGLTKRNWQMTPIFVRWLAYAGLALAIMNFGIFEDVPFIYFQF